jgi:hypothetical protein
MHRNKQPRSGSISSEQLRVPAIVEPLQSDKLRISVLEAEISGLRKQIVVNQQPTASPCSPSSKSCSGTGRQCGRIVLTARFECKGREFAWTELKVTSMKSLCIFPLITVGSRKSARTTILISRLQKSRWRMAPSLSGLNH